MNPNLDGFKLINAREVKSLSLLLLGDPVNLLANK